jgi:hypothetical protein
MAQLAAKASLTSRHFYRAVPVRVTRNVELRQVTSIGASTRHLEFDIAGSGLAYQTADTLYLLYVHATNARLPV